MTTEFRIWRYAGDGITPMRTLGVVGGSPWRTNVYPNYGIDYMSVEFTLERFVFSGAAGEADCPCGEMIEAYDVSELLVKIREHCDYEHRGIPLRGILGSFR